MTNNERVPAGTADRLAAAVAKVPSTPVNVAWAIGANTMRQRCIEYLRGIEAAPLTCTLAEAMAMAEPGDVLRGKCHFDAGHFIMLRGLSKWLGLHSGDATYDVSAPREVAVSWHTFIHNGAVYSIREQADAGGLPNAGKPTCNDVAELSGADGLVNQVEAIGVALGGVIFNTKDGEVTAASCPRLDELAEQLRTLQQDVAALRQQQGGGMGIPVPGDLQQIYDNARRYSEGLVMEDCDKCEGYGYGYVHIGPGDDDEAEVDCTSCLGTGKLPAAEQPADSRTFMGIPIKVNPAMPSDTAVLTDGRHEVTIKPADAPSVVDDPDMNDPWRHIAAIWLRLAKAELALNNETGDLYQQLRALQQRVDKMQGGGKRDEKCIFCPECDGRGGSNEGIPGYPEWATCERCKGVGAWTAAEFEAHIRAEATEQQGGELREGVHITAAGIAKLRQRCHDNYNGGHHDEPAHSAFHHGMDTVCNVLESYLPQPAAPGSTEEAGNV